MLIVGKECYVKTGSSLNEGYFYIKSKVTEVKEGGYKEESAKYHFLGQEIEKVFSTWDDTQVWVEGIDHPFPPERIYFDLPFKEDGVIEIDGDKHILTPIERWQRVPKKEWRETRYIKNLEVEKTTHISGAIRNLRQVITWRCNRLEIVSSVDIGWEDIYKSFAKALAVQRTNNPKTL